MTNVSPIVKFRNISKFYGYTKALSNVNFECFKGEVRAILGENGAGKSTLMKIISGVIAPDEGRVLVDNQSVAFKSPRDAMALGLVCMFQELSLIPDLTVRENILLGTSYNRIGFLSSSILQKARDILDAIGGKDINFKTPVNRLFLSQMQQVEITKALCKNPRLLILDEATSALSVSIVQKVFDLIRIQKKQGVSILFISHRFHEIEQLADTISVFRDGQHIETFNNNTYIYGDIVNKMIGERLDDLFPPKCEPTTNDKSEIILSVDNLCWQQTLKSISFEVKKGQIIGLGGLQGQGQTLLINSLFGILKSVNGTITINEQKVMFNSPKEAKLSEKTRLALVPEDRKSESLIPSLSIMDNMQLALLGIAKLRQSVSIFYYEQFIKRLELIYSSLEQPLSDLSGGNQQKVALIKWLAIAPKCLLLADPTRGIDVKTKAQIYRLIRDLANDGMAIILLSTDYEELIHLCDEVHIFYGGAIRKTLIGEEISAKNIISNSLRIGD